jgi:hypothetical protein
VTGTVFRTPWRRLAGPDPTGFRGVVLELAAMRDNGEMSDAAWMVNREIKCRCGQLGTISGVEGPADRPDFVWVTHMVRLSMQTHIHRSPQMAAVLTQLAR